MGTQRRGVLTSHDVRIADCVGALKEVPAGCVDLAILDPPYFRVVANSWDREWRTAEDYRAWVQGWVPQVADAMRFGGALYLFGYMRNLLRIVPEFETQGFDIRQQIVIDKGLRSISGRHTSKYRMFPVATESLVYMVKDNREHLRALLLERQRQLGLSSKVINDALGVRSNGGGMWSLYTGENLEAQAPTRDLWQRLCKVLDMVIPYESFAVTFHLPMGLTDVWTDIDFYSEPRQHPTQKPLALMQRIVEASSNPGDTVLDPFLGSGSTLLACESAGRRCIGFERDPRYHALSLERLRQCREDMSQQTAFEQVWRDTPP